MIVFRQQDGRYPFLHEKSEQPAARWNADGEGPVQYFSDTPDGAWAEFLRHEEIKDPKELEGIQRTIWAVEIPDGEKYEKPRLSRAKLLGDKNSYGACQAEARRIRKKGSRGIEAPSAALLPGSAGGWKVKGGITRGPARDGKVIALFGKRPDPVGWVAARDGRPDESLLSFVRHF